MTPDERRLDRRGEGPDARATRPSTGARAACRSPPSPRAAPISSAARSTTSSATRTGTRTAGRTSRTATRRRSRSSATGATRSAGRSGSPAAPTSCSSSTATSTGRVKPAATSIASACRRRSSGRATSRRRATTTARSSTLIRDSTTGSAVHQLRHARLLPGWRRARPDSAEPAVSDRHEHPEQPVAAAERRAGAGARLQLRSAGAGHASRCCTSRCSAPTTRCPRRCASRRSTPGSCRARMTDPGSLPGFNDSAALEPQPARPVDHRQLQPVLLDVHRGHLWLQFQRDRQSLREPAVEPRERRAGGPPDAVSAGRTGRSRSTTPRRCSAPPIRRSTPTAGSCIRRTSRGAAASPTRRPTWAPSWRNINPVPRCLVQPDEAARAAHAEGRAYWNHAYKAQQLGTAGRDAVPGRAQLRQRHAEPARQRLRLRECRARRPQLVRPAVASSSKADTSTTTSIGTCRTTGR